MLKLYIVVKNMKPLFGGKLVKFNAANVVKFLENDKWDKYTFYLLPDINSWLTRKVPDAGKDWGQKEKRASEDEVPGWHHRCNGHELGQTLGDGEE